MPTEPNSLSDLPDARGLIAAPAAWSALGFVFGVRCPGQHLDLVAAQFSGLPKAPGAEAQHIFEIGSSSESWPQDLYSCIGVVTMNAIAASAGQLLLHAGAASDAAGGVAVLCGRSGSGKSTLTALLVQDGLAYLTDETVRLDPASLRITPFRRPALLKGSSHKVLPHLEPGAAVPGPGVWVVSPAALGGPMVPDAPLLPRLLIFPSYARKAAGCHVEPITPGRAGYLLGEQSSRLRLVHGGPLPALARLVRRAPAYRLRYSDGARAAAAVRTLLEAA